MKVLITGATGLVGSRIVSILNELGVSVHYFTRSLKATELIGAKAFLWNPDQFEFDRQALVGVTHVINLAGASIAKRWTRTYKNEIVRSRVNSLKTLKLAIESNADSKAIRVLSASAIGIYASDNYEQYTESSVGYGDDFLAEVVKIWEEAADELSPQLHSLCKVRIGIVLDRNQGALPKLLAPIKWGLGAPLGSGNQWQSWIHIDDLAQLFVFLLQNQLGPTVNGVAPNAIRQKELTERIAATIQRPLWLPSVPAWFLKLILGQMSAVVLQSQKVVSKSIEASDFEFQFTSVTTALEDLLQTE